MTRFLYAFITGALITTSAHAARFEKSMGLGLSFYSGADAQYVAPVLTPAVSFSANVLYKNINLVNHFEFQYLSGGVNFAGSLGTYSGYAGIYEFAVRLNLAKDTLQPYIEAGPTLGMFALTATGAPASQSKNQTAMKYGYVIGTGFDSLKAPARGESSGWGIGFSYFSYLSTPSIFEFPAGKLGAKGIKLEFRYVLQPSK